jgi:hypothetical protein
MPSGGIRFTGNRINYRTKAENHVKEVGIDMGSVWVHGSLMGLTE